MAEIASLVGDTARSSNYSVSHRVTEELGRIGLTVGIAVDRGFVRDAVAELRDLHGRDAFDALGMSYWCSRNVRA